MLARNKVGVSQWSVISVGATGALAPDAPTGVAVAGASPTSLRMSWSAPYSGGSAITSYEVQCRATGTVMWEDCEGVVSGLTAGISG